MKKEKCGVLLHLLPLLGLDLIQEILVRLPVVSLLRFKSVSKSWCTFIQSSFFVDLHTAHTFSTSSSSSSNNQFGSFILLASLLHSREHSYIMLSSESCYESNSDDSESESDWPWIRRSIDGEVAFVEALSKDQVFKVDMHTDDDDLGGGEEEGSNDHQQLVLKLKCLGVSPEYESCSFFKQVIGSCNGLVIVCIYVEDFNQFYLCNPATRKHRILPKPIKIGMEGELSPCRGSEVAGFGFVGEDYKVVLLTYFRPRFESFDTPASQPKCLFKVQVYSLSTNSWSLINQGIMISLPGDPTPYPNQRLYLNATSSVYFMAEAFQDTLELETSDLPGNDRVIVKFDFTKHTFAPIVIPKHEKKDSLYLTYFGDNIALFIECPAREVDDYSIWVLKEDGDDNKWEKLCSSFKIQHIIPGERNFPIGISNDGEFALLSTMNSAAAFGKKIKLYHFASEQVKRNFLTCTDMMNTTNPYKPSLVSIIGGKTAEAEAEAATDFLQRCDLGTN